MTGGHDPLRACRGKNRYAIEENAYAVAAIFKRDGTWLRVYACDDCGGYHLTHRNALPQHNRWAPPKASRRAEANMRQREAQRRRGRRGRG
jgi:hypothetical protein